MFAVAESISTGGFAVRHLGLARHERRQWSRNEHTKVCVVTRGCLVDDVCADARLAHVLFHPVGAPIRIAAGNAGAVTVTLEITGHRYGELLASGVLPESATYVRSKAALGIARRIALELKSPDGCTPLALESLALDLLVQVFRGPRERLLAAPRWLIGVRDQIHDSPLATRHLADYARDAGVHPMHLARSFRRYFGHSVGEYVRRQRVVYAANLLADTDRGLADVALTTGFCDQAHFSRIFKRIAGLTPMEHRRIHRR